MMTVIDWLLESDPAIRWQMMRDLTDEPTDSVAVERARVADEGWGASVLAPQADDGQWAGGTYYPAAQEEPGQPWTATALTLQRLRSGADPADPRVRRAVARVRHFGRWLLENTHPGAVHFELEDGNGNPADGTRSGRCAC
jgi:hypothetical protein